MTEIAANVIGICSNTCGITTAGVGALLMCGAFGGYWFGAWCGYKLGKAGRRSFRKGILE